MSTSTPSSTVANEAIDLLTKLGALPAFVADGSLIARSPIDGQIIGRLKPGSDDDTRAAIARARTAFLTWRTVPAPRRGELVRLLGEELRSSKELLGRLVTIEAGKILSEGLGEVQEMIDICDFAVGLSRQLYGLTIASERPGHRMMETWHPAGVCGIITAFNFPVAVWCWNAALALVCGNAVVWKPSEKTPLTARAVQAIVERALARFGDAPQGLAELVQGDRTVGEIMVDHPDLAILSATGSTRMGKQVGPRVAARFGRAILELGGNNAAIVTPSADQDLALRSIAFSAMGTAGQRCTSLRRLFVHEDIADDFVSRLSRVYRSVTIGDPREPLTLVGPLIDAAAFEAMGRALDEATSLGGKVHGGTRVDHQSSGAYYVAPALVEMPSQTGPVPRETFAPILYVMRYHDLAEAIASHNAVPQGLASSIFTIDIREAETFISAVGSDCGIANVNIGPSGAEIGGAFGGEKETGGGRESGSDAWRGYMRRATNTINYSRELPLAQGVKFDVG
ncbi:aldehyde dehydrogenase family protein [Bradyrhizobium sp. Arg237L]|nr:aldehyde dehydrogenase family protein [Bradyrhizobium sp. Arg237L]MDI4238873.1 aldehyde dehydrogenase family protein [Bradyrhizobium sp. Arg237L]